MNKNLYRVIFNKARGMLMVVAEIAASHGGISSSCASGPALLQRISALTRLKFALAFALGCVSFAAGAGIVADRQAPGNQQPTIISAANGTPQINIQTPSAAGVSRNVYSQFDVEKKGAVLNNSHANTQTQLAGMVSGNPWLAKGEAKIILNEVNASRASQLNGFIEVAGQKAQVVIANPAGITCDGCGFINAHRATLTTGQPQLSNGQLTGYDVERGEIVIQGAGLESRLQDKTDLIARAVKVNAGLWANELNVTTGRNKVDAAHQAIAPKSTDGSAKPTLAIDVAALGGMYANKIRLRGTEAGVGVSNAGHIGASAGDVTVDANGMLTNTGSLTSSQHMLLKAEGAIASQGKIYAAGNVEVRTEAELVNTGSIAAAQNVSLSAASIRSAPQSTLAAGVNSDGKMGSSGNLILNSKGELRASGQNLAAGELVAKGTKLDLSGSQTAADTITLIATSGDITTAGGRLAATRQLAAQTEGTLNNDGGELVADELKLTASRLSNQQGLIQQTGKHDLQLVHAAGIDNRQGTISSSGENLTLQTTSLNNELGVISGSGKNLMLQTDSLNNEQGKILHTGDGKLTLEAAQIAGSQSTVISNGALALNSATLVLDNAVTQAASIEVKADTLSNRSGQLLQSGNGTMKLTIAGILDNQGGTLASAGALALSASDLFNQQGKTIVTDRYSLEAILANGLQNREGVIASGGDLKLSSQKVDNSAGLLQSGGTLSLDTHQKELLNNNGTVYSTGSATLNTGDLTSIDGRILAQDLNINAQAVDNHSGTVQAQNGLVLIGGQISNQQGTLAAGNTMTLRSEAFDNSQGGAVASNGTLTLLALSLANGSGRIGAQGDVRLDTTRTIDNASGLIYSSQSLTLTAKEVLNQNTRGDSQGIQGNNITLNADELVNSQGAVLADNHLRLNLGDMLDNSGGLISSLAETRLEARRIDNEAGSLEAGSLLAVTGEALNGIGRALSLGDMTLTLAQDFTNGGTLQAEGNLTLASLGKIHNQGLIQAGQTLSLTANGMQNDAAAEISAATTMLNAGKSLVNYGLIDGFTTRLSGDIVSNIGSGRIYGDALAIKAGTLNNLAANGVAATIAARQRLDIGAVTLNNRDHALIYSDGSLTIGGTLNGDGLATGQAATLNNHSATIESAGAMALNVREINNINDRFELENVLVSQEAISEYEVNKLKDGKRYNDKDYTIYIYKDETYIVCIEGVICGTTDGDRFTHYQYTRTTTEDRVKETDPAKIIAGGSLQINAGSLLNDKSQIVAGGTLAVNAASVDNVEVEAFRQINDAGLATAYSRHQQKDGDSPIVKVSDYVPPTVIQTIDLNASTLEDHTRAQSSNPNVGDYQTVGIDAQIQGAGKNDRAQIVLPAGKTFEVQMQSGESVVRVAGPNISLPDNSLFMVQPQSTSAYLVETDPRFASQKQWLSSDYMMDAFATDPNNVLKRLGDGYYEQRLIREQVIALSGQRYLAGQQSDEEQYKMLMNNGIEFGKTYNLTPGVALTSEQMSLLTGDMVWMVTQSVRLADGSTQQVLVPQVYAVVKPGDLDGSGALLAANNIGLNLSGELTNSGRITSRQSTQILADTLTNLGGQLRGDSLELKAQTDINNIGGVMAANSSLLLSAGRDINATTTTRSAESEDGRFARTTIDSVAGFYVEQSNGTLVLQAGRDINLQAAQVVNSGEDGTLALSAGRDLNLTTVGTASRDNLSWGKDYQNHTTSSQIGTDIVGSGRVSLDAAQNISVTAGNISADRQLSLTAGNDINLQHAVETATLDQYYKATGSNGALSSKTVESRDTFSHQTVNGSQLSADSVTAQAGRDITVTGSSVAATQDVSMSAGNNLNVQSATTQQQEFSFYKEKKSGISGTGGIGFTVGSSSLKTTDEGKVLSNTGSTLGSIEGSVNLSAGNALTVKGSDVLAGKDISLTGKEVNILAAENSLSLTHKTEQKQSGLTVALSGTAGSALNAAVTTANEARKESDGRLAALQGIKAALSGVSAQQAYELDGLQTSAAEAKNAAAGLKPGDEGYEKGATNTVGVSISYGSQSSKSESSLTQITQQGSSLTAGNSLTVTATGTDVNVQGSRLQAGKDVQLSANRDVNLVSAEESSSTRSQNSSKGGSVGVGITAGSGGAGLNVSASVNKGKGHENADSVSHVETQVNAGSQVTIISGRDATLAGAQVSGEAVKADVGRNLTISSEQDSETYDAKQQSASAGAGYTVGGAATASVSATRDKMNSDWRSVTEQSGIFAGAGGFDIKVGEHTQLDGAVIASTATADKNKLDTGTLGWRDIENHAEYSVEHVGAGISTGGTLLDQFKGNMANGVLAGLNGSDSADSVTKAAVSEGTIVIRDGENQTQAVAELSRDVENANPGLEQIFDKEKEQNRLRAAQLIAEIGSQALDIARTEGQIAGEKAKRDPAALAAAKAELAGKGKLNPTADEIAKQAYDTAMKPFGTGSALQQGLQAATAAIQGLAGGSVAQAVSGAAAPYLAEVIHDMTTTKGLDGKEVVNREANLMAHAVVGAVTAWAAGNSALAGASGAAMGEFIAQQLYPDIARENLTEEQRQTISALGTLAAGLAGGVAGDSTADAVAGAQAGKNSVENNNLSSKQIDAWSAEMKACQAGGGDCSGIIKKYEELSTAQQKQLISDCATSPATCQQKYGDVLADSMAVKQAIDRAMGEDIPIKMVYDLTATWAHQMDADGIVASNKVSEQIMAKYGLDQAQADIIAGVALSALGGVSKAGKPKYQPNQGAVGNMKEFLTQSGFGSQIKSSTQKTSQIYQGQSVYKANENIGSVIKPGDQFYLDGQHKNHLEVFDSKGRFKAVLNLDGSINQAKTEAAKGRKL